jgi:5-methylcytosine-specific restriction endonuclease McrA
MSESAKGKIISLETRRRISQSLNGRPVLETTRKKIGEANRGRLLGSRHPQWLGGISREPYAFVWTKDLKAYIMERDGYECKNRTCHNDSSKLSVHHIDYDKKNCDHDNLITLCNSCNARANFNREMWEKYYHSLIDNALNVQGVL